MKLLIAILILTTISDAYANCGCHNGGQCDASSLSCKCADGFYGPICNQYAETYKLVFLTTPNVKFTHIKEQLVSLLSPLKIKEFAEVGLRLGNVYKIRFYKPLSVAEREQVKSIAVTASNNVRVKNLVDFDECEDGQSCFDGLKCKNTEYSFKCDCPAGYEAKDFRCVSEVNEDNENTKTVIYVWAGAVAAVVLFMVACLVFYRHRKIEKERRLEREEEKKANTMFRNVLSPTNMSEFDNHGRRVSPTASVVEAGRAYNMPPDLASLYSYPYGQEPDYYKNQRLSIPMDGVQNAGYDTDPMRYQSTGSYGQQSYGIPAQEEHFNGKTPLGTSPNDSNPQFNATPQVSEEQKS